MDAVVDFVSVDIVHLFEIIEIDEKYGAGLSVPSRSLKRSFLLLGKGASVEQAGRRIRP